MTASDPDCYSCRSISGERRISPGPVIYEREHWLVEHAYPCAMKGWLVVVLRRHAAALHELSTEEFAQLGEVLERVVGALRRHLGCEKEYAACFGEAEHFNHVHVHIVGKPQQLAQELKGPAIFKMLKPGEREPVSPEEIREFCTQMQAYFNP